MSNPAIYTAIDLADKYADLKFRIAAGSWTYEQEIGIAKEVYETRTALMEHLKKHITETEHE